uniref:Uncharacterized protein n=1 Tax=Octopus bimaculoides TaxID=37653 RepID=A0A0L8GTI8_OCTBM
MCLSLFLFLTNNNSKKKLIFNLFHLWLREVGPHKGHHTLCFQGRKGGFVLFKPFPFSKALTFGNGKEHKNRYIERSLLFGFAK